MDSYDSYTSDAAALSTVLLILGLACAAVAVVAVINWLLIAVPLSALFGKAGIERWKAWIPFYSTFTWLRLGGHSGHWMWLSFVPSGSLVTRVFLNIGTFRTGKAFGKDAGFLALGVVLPWVWLCILGFGRGAYRPELIAAAGLPAPLEGAGAQKPVEAADAPFHYEAAPYAQR